MDVMNINKQSSPNPTVAATWKLVRFVGDASPYAHNELASFAPDVAAALVAAGIAIYV